MPKKNSRSSVLIINLWPGAPMHYTIQLANQYTKNYQVTVLLSKNCVNIDAFQNVDIERASITIPRRYKDLKSRMLLLNPIAYLQVIFWVRKLAADRIITAFFHPYLLFLFIFFQNITFIDHDPRGHIGEKYFGLLFLQKCCKYLSDKVIVHSDQLIPHDIPQSQRRKYQIRPHGSFDFLLKKGNPDIEPQNQILFVGRFVKYKGVEYLIRAFAEIQNDFPDWQLVIKGSGDPYFESELNKINPDQLIYENRFLSDDELADTVRRCKIMVLPYVDGSQSGIIELGKIFSKSLLIAKAGILERQCNGSNCIMINNIKSIDGFSNKLKNIIKLT